MTAPARDARSHGRALAWSGGRLDLAAPRVMGVLNVTPDSFSDGGRYLAPEAAVARAHEMVAEGAAIIDVGGESTRPGAAPVDADEELRRVLPVIERLVSELSVPVSIDTGKPQVITTAVAAGAAIVNDVRALGAPGALHAVVAAECAVCLMHMQGEPRTMQKNPHYDDVVEDVCAFLEARADACVDAGIPRDHILLDPGFGFGKTTEHNVRLLHHLPELLDLGFPLVVGLSRKATIGQLSGVQAAADRVAGSIAAAVLAAWLGASVIRAHDVRATVEALAVTHAVGRAA